MRELLARFRLPVAMTLYVGIALLLVLGQWRSAGRSELGLVGVATFSVASVSEKLVHAGTADVGGIWDRYVDLTQVKEENEKLRAEVDRLRDENSRLLGVMQENARLRALVGFAEGHPGFELVPARVFAKELSPLFRVVSVTIEADDARVEPGMPVVSSAGVVGHVGDVVGDTATVLLAVDPRSSIDVLIQRNRARGVLRGNGSDGDYFSRIAYLLRRDGATPGDVVVTSGMGGRFPPDLVVGRIVSVPDQRFGLFQEVVVEPSVDFSRLEEVFVVVGTN